MDKTDTTEHLGKILGREDKHQFILHIPITGKITHRLHIFLFAVFKLCLQCLELRLQNIDVPIDIGNILLYALNAFLPFINGCIQQQQILQTLLHIFLIGLESLLLNMNLFLDLRTLILQSFN